ncbi:MAG: hypothetical protein SAJ12_01195 [Jaaginema sp. PMC 1079.18]|nr:hypothetical protein [Jaaginema sp. PMC 1080.18]MEC4849600.1 hypothetical protein [Jaaginema sp. PMC 1079.18]MEC4867112.1 hypothetical protein [Jaaginema sp. PMC 1078.18]
MPNKLDELGAMNAISVEITLGQAVINAYMLPSGEKRLGIENVGLALGYSEQFFFTKTKRQSKTLQTLKNMGFSGEYIWVQTTPEHSQQEPLRARTVGLRDFVKFVTLEATKKRNHNAIILLAAFAEVGIERIVEDAFAGHSTNYLQYKIVHYRNWTHEEYEEVLEYNRNEVKALYP